MGVHANILLRKKRIVFLFGIFLIAAICIGVMNLNYNRLSRYAHLEYMSFQDQELFNEYLSDKDIDYIIEWSISPHLIIDYVDKEGFNVYHLQQYNELGNYHTRLSDENVVLLVEQTFNLFSTSELIKWLEHYDEQSVINWLRDGDVYNPQGAIVSYPDMTSTFLSDDLGVSTRIPYVLKEITTVPVADETRPQILEEVIGPLENMCVAISAAQLNDIACGGIVVEQGYVSYQQQVAIYESALLEYGQDVLRYEDYPGHSEHQLGWTLDFGSVTDEDFASSPQYDWLVQNAHLFGFIQMYSLDDEQITSKAQRANQWRYVGVETATSLFVKNQDYKEIEP